MYGPKLVFFSALLALPAIPGVAQSPTPDPVASRPIPATTVPAVRPTHGAAAPSAAPPISLSNCTFTAEFAPNAPPAPDGPAMTAPHGSRQYVIATYSVKPSLLTPGSGVATVSAEPDVLPDIEALASERTVIAKAVLLCPPRSSTLIDARVGTISNRRGARTFGFTLVYGVPGRPKR